MWGDPIYRWDYHESTEFAWWKQRPGIKLFDALKKTLSGVNIIAEDLGFMTDTVRMLVLDTGFPNMKVLEFAFDERDSGNRNEYLPHNYVHNSVVYTGTHDNETVVGWLGEITKAEYEMVKSYVDYHGDDDKELADKMIRLAHSSVADICIIPFQDYLHLDNSARINKPSTLGGNWVWRMNAEDMNADLAEKSTSCPNYTDEDKTMANLTIKDIAKLCGVGTSTVSRAMNDDPGINPETKERILKVVKEFHYVPNNSARNLKVSESNTVGVLVKGRNNSFFQGMYTFIEQELQKIGYDFILKEISWDDNNTMQAVEMVKEQRLKGLIFLGGMIEDLDKIRQHIDIPYVFCTVAVDYNATDCNLVAIDDEKESYKIVDYLIKKGHRKIAIICGQKGDFAVGRLRLKGYKLALEANGIEYNPGLVAYQRDDLPDYSLANGYAAMKDLLGSGEEFTAVYVISDLMAFGAYKAIYDAGKKIPDDYSIVGFDGIEMTKYMYPALTTVRQPVEEMITCAVELLAKAINGEDTGRQIFFAGELMEQDSVKDITH